MRNCYRPINLDDGRRHQPQRTTKLNRKLQLVYWFFSDITGTIIGFLCKNISSFDIAAWLYVVLYFSSLKDASSYAFSGTLKSVFFVVSKMKWVWVNYSKNSLFFDSLNAVRSSFTSRMLPPIMLATLLKALSGKTWRHRRFSASTTWKV